MYSSAFFGLSAADCIPYRVFFPPRAPYMAVGWDSVPSFPDVRV